MIQVDDSGWGSLLGGVMIGVHNTNTGVMKSKLIPVSHFQLKKFSKALYRDYATMLFLQMWLVIGDSNHFQICRGTVLDGIYNIMKHDRKKRFLERVEIGDPFQSWLENRFAQTLKRVGVPRISDGAHCLSFDGQLDWVKEDPKRVRYVKTGWPSWKQKYSNLVMSK